MVRDHKPWAQLAAVLMLAASVITRERCVFANGRFPFAQALIVGPSGADQQIVLRATFGLVVSRDAGRNFAWICEQSMGYEGNWDPPTVFATNTLLVGLPTGLSETQLGCAFAANPTVATTPIIDLAATADGARVWAIEAVPAAVNRVFYSLNAGRDFTVGARGERGVELETIEFAPSDLQRVYVTGTDPNAQSAVLYRSDDGGRTMTRLPPLAMDVVGAFVSGVDARDRDIVWLRVKRSSGSALLRSSDGGMTFRPLVQSTGELLGFALAADGRVWVGGLEDGLLYSANGEQFARVSPVRVSCLRHRDNALYLCADWLAEPFAIAKWTDGEPAMQPLLQFSQIRGPVACAADSATSIECAPRWPLLQQNLVRRPAADGGRMDVQTDSPGDGGIDVTAQLDSGSAPMDAPMIDDRSMIRSGCHCRASALRAQRSTLALYALFALVLGGRRRASDAR